MNVYIVTLTRYGLEVDLEVQAPNMQRAKHEAQAIQGDDWNVKAVERTHEVRND